jgi:hypothetical protein
MNSAWSRHVPVCFPEPNDASIAGPTKEHKIGAIWFTIVVRQALDIGSLLSDQSDPAPTLGIPAFESAWLQNKSSPDFDERSELVTSDSSSWSQGRHHSSATEKRFYVSPVIAGKIGNYLTSDPVFASDPL